MVLDENLETFVVHMTSFNLALSSGIHPDRAVQIASLLTENIKILEEYLDFTDIFSVMKALMLPKQTKFNEYVIELEKGK